MKAKGQNFKSLRMSGKGENPSLENMTGRKWKDKPHKGTDEDKNQREGVKLSGKSDV